MFFLYSVILTESYYNVRKHKVCLSSRPGGPLGLHTHSVCWATHGAYSSTRSGQGRKVPPSIFIIGEWISTRMDFNMQTNIQEAMVAQPSEPRKMINTSSATSRGASPTPRITATQPQRQTHGTAMINLNVRKGGLWPLAFSSLLYYNGPRVSVCLSVCVSSTALTAGLILMKFHTNSLQDMGL